MGFKRTSDGRIFFQGSGGTANDEQGLSGGAQSEAQVDLPEAEPDFPFKTTQSHTQLQILSLLKSLNERLKTTQAERNFMRRQLEDYRSIIEELAEKTGQNEQAFQKIQERFTALGEQNNDGGLSMEDFIRDTLREMEKTRRMLLNLETKTERADQNMADLQKFQQEQAKKIARTAGGYAELTDKIKESEERQDILNSRIDDALSRQETLSQKVDQAIEDRARFMRKIERIEETVIQTRDALNAKAVALMAAQQAAEGAVLGNDKTLGEALLEDKTAPLYAQRSETVIAIEEDKSKRFNFQGAMIPALFFTAIVAGLFIGNNQMPHKSKPLFPATVQTKAPEATAANTAAPAQTGAADDWSVERDTSAFSEDAILPQDAEVSDAPFPGALKAQGLESDAQMEEMMDEAPDALAEKLNALEPGEPEMETGTETLAQVQSTAPERDLSAFQPAAPGNDAGADPALPEAIRKVEEQALAGSPEAQHDLAAIYIAGHGGVKQDYDRAAYWFRKAADQGIANAKYNLGVLYHQGLGVKPNIDEALYWYDSAAAAGHPEAQYNLGIAYIEGIGVPYMPAKAADYFEKAARSGVIEAAYNLGLIYENGLLGQPKPDEALMWYKLAADKGSPEAKEALTQLAKTLNVSLEDVNRLAEDVKAVKVGNDAAQNAVKAPAKAKSKAPLKEISDEEISLQIQPVAIETDGELTSMEQEFEQILIGQVQGQLMRLGLYPGPADGMIGPLTSDAIRAYQNAHGLTPDGAVSTALLDHMTQTAAGE